MKIAIFGATGSVGLHLVEQALAAGHEVTAFVRNQSKIEMNHPNFRTIQGNVLDDFNQIRQAVNGQDAVLITLGAGIKGRIRAEGTRNIISAMEQCGVERLICQSTLGAGDSVGNLDLKWRLIFGVPLRFAMADHQKQEDWVRRSNLTWTIIRPSSFTDEPMSGDYKFGFSSREKNLTLKIPRADVAHFMLDQLEKKQFHGQAVSLSC